MRKSLIISVIAIALFSAAGCDKPGTGDGPELILDQVNTQNVPRKGLLRFDFTFNSGQVADSVYVMFTRETLPLCEPRNFDLAFKVPDYPSSATKGQMEINMVNGDDGSLASPQCGDDETLTFKFVLVDIKGNKSDTISSPPIVLLK